MAKKPKKKQPKPQESDFILKLKSQMYAHVCYGHVMLTTKRPFIVDVELNLNTLHYTLKHHLLGTLAVAADKTSAEAQLFYNVVTLYTYHCKTLINDTYLDFGIQPNTDSLDKLTDYLKNTFYESSSFF